MHLIVQSFYATYFPHTYECCSSTPAISLLDSLASFALLLFFFWSRTRWLNFNVNKIVNRYLYSPIHFWWLNSALYKIKIFELSLWLLTKKYLTRHKNYIEVVNKIRYSLQPSKTVLLHYNVCHDILVVFCILVQLLLATKNGTWYLVSALSACCLMNYWMTSD